MTAVAADERQRFSVALAALVFGAVAMGASVLRNKMKKAGFEDVTVTNKAIAALEDDVDLVITQAELTERARQRTPGAIHVSVDNFMNSPKYDEVVSLVREQHGQ